MRSHGGDLFPCWTCWCQTVGFQLHEDMDNKQWPKQPCTHWCWRLFSGSFEGRCVSQLFGAENMGIFFWPSVHWSSLVVSSFKQNKATSTNTMQHLSPKTVKLLNAIVSPTALICLVRLHYHSPNDTIRSSMLFNQKCCEPWWVGENWRWRMVRHDEAHEHTCGFRMQ